MEHRSTANHVMEGSQCHCIVQRSGQCPSARSLQDGLIRPLGISLGCLCHNHCSKVILVSLRFSTGISDNVAVIPRLMVEVFLVERTCLHRCIYRGYRDEGLVVGLEGSWFITWMNYFAVDLPVTSRLEQLCQVRSPSTY